MTELAGNALQQRVLQSRQQGELLLAALRERITALELPGERVGIPPFESARFKLEHDLYDGNHTLRAAFFPSEHYCIGFMLFHADGSSFAEYHVMRPHPARPQLFIEAVEAWGSVAGIKTDLRVVLMPG